MAKVLLIDDSPAVISVVSGVLRNHGHEVASIDIFVELPGVLSSFRPDVIVLDLNMPGMDGLTMGEYIRRFQDWEIPLIVHSSLPDDRLREAVDALGAVAAVRKRDTEVELPRRIREISGGHAVAASL